MEDFDDDDDDNFSEPSGINPGVFSYLEDKFNFPNAGPDNVKPVQSATGFDAYLNDRFQ